MVRHSRKEFVRLHCTLIDGCTGNERSHYKHFYECECDEDEIEKLRVEIQRDFDSGQLTFVDHDELNKQLDIEIEQLD
jgi:hypothetical protein